LQKLATFLLMRCYTRYQITWAWNYVFIRIIDCIIT